MASLARSSAGYGLALSAAAINIVGFAVNDARDAMANVRKEGSQSMSSQSQEVMNNDIIICGYPKSGSTWLQMIACQVVAGNASLVGHMRDWCPYLGSQPHIFVSHSDGAPRFFKSHTQLSRLPDRCRYIYIVRSPGDVLVSYYSHLTSTSEFVGSLEAFAEAFLTGDILYGSWFSHIRDAALALRTRRVLVLSYEALWGDLRKSIEEVALFCGYDVTGRVHLVTEACSFAEMKLHAAQLDPRPSRPGLQSSDFFRAGKVGAGTGLDPGVQQRLHELLEDLARRTASEELARVAPWWPTFA